MTQNVHLIPRNERMAMNYLRKLFVAAARTQCAVAVEQEYTKSKSAKSQNSPLDATKPQNKEKVMMVTPHPLEYRPGDPMNARFGDDQVRKPVYIAIKLDKNFFADRPATPTIVVRELKTAQGSDTDYNLAFTELVSNDDGWKIMRNTNEVPKLNEDQTRHAVPAIQSEY